MATKFVDSAAAGLNDGTSWTDAWTSIASAVGVAAGDIVKIDDGHSQTSAANHDFTNGTNVNPVYLICVDKNNSDALSTGAVLQYSGNNTGVRGSVYAYGITFDGTANVNCPTLGALDLGKSEYHNCIIKQTVAGLVQLGVPNNFRTINRFFDCDLDFSAATGAGVACILAAGSHILEFIGGTVTCRATQTSLFRCDLADNADTFFRSTVFTGTVTNLIDSDATDFAGTIVLDRCTLPTYTNIFDTAITHYRGRVELRNCGTGTITLPIVGPALITDRAGTVAASLTKFRTNGADDGDQADPYSWEVVAGASGLDYTGFVRLPPITRKVATGSQDITIFVASGTTLQDNEFWIEVESPSEAGSATPTGRWQTTRSLPLATAADLTTDATSTWNGAGVGTKQKITVTIAPTVKGEVVVHCFFAKASTTIYVDPVIDVDDDTDGKSRMIMGIQMFDPNEGTIVQTVIAPVRRTVR